MIMQDPECWTELSVSSSYPLAAGKVARKVATWQERLDGQSLRILCVRSDSALAECGPIFDHVHGLQDLTVDCSVQARDLAELLKNVRGHASKTLISLHLRCPPDSCSYPDVFLLLSCFPRLQRCRIVLPSSNNRGQLDLPPLAMGDTVEDPAVIILPSVRDLNVSLDQTSRPLSFHLNCPNLQHLVWAGTVFVRPDRLQLPSLQSLETCYMPVECPPGPYRFEHLTRLRLGTKDAPPRLDLLDLPSLESLQLSGGRYPQLATDLPAFASRSPLVSSRPSTSITLAACPKRSSWLF
jgi:hypothetical protein